MKQPHASPTLRRCVSRAAEKQTFAHSGWHWHSSLCRHLVCDRERQRLCPILEREAERKVANVSRGLLRHDSNGDWRYQDSRGPRTEQKPERCCRFVGAGNDWEWEWKSFRALAQKAQDLGCDFRLRLLVGHSEAWKRINREAGAAIASAFTNLDELWALLRDEKFCPNIIHFLCHGTAGKDPVMHCATILDHETHSQQRLDIVTPGEILRRLPKNQFLWMIVLNCCELAEATAENQQSFARGLVGNEAPVVIAHRAPIEVTDAATVTCGLYESIFAKAAAASGESAQEVEWADVLAIARDKLLNNHRKGTGPQTEENTRAMVTPGGVRHVTGLCHAYESRRS